MSYLLGIDLGTTYTAAAVQRLRDGAAAGEPEMVALGSHGSEMPSVVLAGEDGSLLVGDAAERRAMAEPDRVAREFKRRIGDPTPVSLGGRSFTAPELAGIVVRHVVRTVTAREGEPPSRITLTHPASWGAHKLKLLLSAVSAADGVPVSLLAEPQAAAVCYAAAERIRPGSTIAVYDLGGGTFDAALVHKAAGVFTLLGRPEGVEFLGGVDFDEVVFEHVRAGAPEVFAGLDESDPAVWAAVARLRRECREAKEALSADTEVSVPVWLGGAQDVVRLHRAEFEELIAERVEDTVEALRRAIGSAGLGPDQVSSVLLVGGSSRIPLVAQTVSERLGRPVAVDADPKNAIAKGAALSLLPDAGSSWPQVELPVQRAVPAEEAVERTGPITGLPIPAFRDDMPTERFAAVGLLDPETRVDAPAGEMSAFGTAYGTSAYVTQEPAAGTDSRPRWLIGAGGLVGALAIIAAVLFWPVSSPALDAAGARPIIPDTAVPTPAPVLPAPVTAAPAPDPGTGTASAGEPTANGKRQSAPVRGGAPAPVAKPPAPAPPVVVPPPVNPPKADPPKGPVTSDPPKSDPPKQTPPTCTTPTAPTGTTPTATPAPDPSCTPAA